MSTERVAEITKSFRVRIFQEDGMTFGQVIRDKKVLYTIGQDKPTQLITWSGEARNRKGELKIRDRSTTWSQKGINLRSSLDRILYRAVAAAILAEEERLGD